MQVPSLQTSTTGSAYVKGGAIGPSPPQSTRDIEADQHDHSRDLEPWLDTP